MVSRGFARPKPRYCYSASTAGQGSHLEGKDISVGISPHLPLTDKGVSLLASRFQLRGPITIDTPSGHYFATSMSERSALMELP